MSPFALALRGLLRQPARAALGISGIAVVGALLFDMLLLSRGLVLSFESVLDEMGFDVRVTATEALPGMGPAIATASAVRAALERLPEVEQVVPVRFGVAEIVVSEDVDVDIEITGHGGPARGVWTLIEGNDLAWEGPAALGTEPPSVLINRHMRDARAMRVGDVVRLRGRCDALVTGLPTLEFVVRGVIDFQFDAPGRLLGATTLENFERLCATARPDEVDFFLVASRAERGTAAALEAIGRARPELHAFSNGQLVSRLEATDFSYFRQISIVLATVTLFFAFLLIATLLTVSVNQRFGEIATLRAIGFTRRRVVADLLWESVLFVGTGGLIAIPLAFALARWLDAILRSMPDFPERLHFFVFSPAAAFAYAGLMVAAGVLAAAYPVFIAARLPIAATLRRETVG